MIFEYMIRNPLAVVKDATFGESGKVMAEFKTVEVSSSSLERMLSHYIKHLKGLKFPENISDDEKFMRSFEEHIRHPIRNLVRGRLIHSGAIFIQMKALPLEKFMLLESEYREFWKLVWAMFKLSASIDLPSCALWWFKDKGYNNDANGRLNLSRIIVGEATKMVNLLDEHLALHNGSPENQVPVKEMKCFEGLLLLVVDKMYKTIEPAAKGTLEWAWVKARLIELGKPGTVFARRMEILGCLRKLRCFKNLQC